MWGSGLSWRYCQCSVDFYFTLTVLQTDWPQIILCYCNRSLNESPRLTWIVLYGLLVQHFYGKNRFLVISRLSDILNGQFNSLLSLVLLSPFVNNCGKQSLPLWEANNYYFCFIKIYNVASVNQIKHGCHPSSREFNADLWWLQTLPQNFDINVIGLYYLLFFVSLMIFLLMEVLKNLDSSIELPFHVSLTESCRVFWNLFVFLWMVNLTSICTCELELCSLTLFFTMISSEPLQPKRLEGSEMTTV